MTCDLEIGHELQIGCLFLLGSIIFELVVGTNKWGGFTKSRIPAFLAKLRRSNLYK